MAPRQDPSVTFTKPRHLIVAGVLAALAVFLLIRVSYGAIPPIPLFAGATLLVVAVVDLTVALTLGVRVQRREGRDPGEALTAARALALAKASALVGSIMAGVWLGVLGYVGPRGMTVPQARADLGSALVGLVSAAVLIAAGLFLERRLRNPDEPDEPAPRDEDVE